MRYVSEFRRKKTTEEFDFLNKYQGIIIHYHYSMYYNYDTGYGEFNVHILRCLNAVREFTKHKWTKDLKELLKSLNSNACKEDESGLIHRLIKYADNYLLFLKNLCKFLK